MVGDLNSAVDEEVVDLYAVVALMDVLTERWCDGGCWCFAGFVAERSVREVHGVVDAVVGWDCFHHCWYKDVGLS